jgi:hypothetical protein
MMIAPSPVRRRCNVWLYAADLLKEAASGHSCIPPAEAEALVRAQVEKIDHCRAAEDCN